MKTKEKTCLTYFAYSGMAALRRFEVEGIQGKFKWGKLKACSSLTTQDAPNLKFATCMELPDIYFFFFALTDMLN